MVLKLPIAVRPRPRNQTIGHGNPSKSTFFHCPWFRRPTSRIADSSLVLPRRSRIWRPPHRITLRTAEIGGQSHPTNLPVADRVNTTKHSRRYGGPDLGENQSSRGNMDVTVRCETSEIPTGVDRYLAILFCTSQNRTATTTVCYTPKRELHESKKHPSAFALWLHLG